MENIATALKVLGHPERLRILALLSRGELTVSELVQILGLSQPRVTQYINSLEGAGIIERLKEGSWVFSRIRRGNVAISALVATTLTSLPQDDAVLKADRRRLQDVRNARAVAAAEFFANVANDRGQLGDEYLPQADIEAKMIELLGQSEIEFMVDLGTGTGRILEVFAKVAKHGSGIDNNTDMLKVARANLDQNGMDHLSVRQGDLHATPLESGVADLVTLHQVLHYLDEPNEAIIEASRIMETGGQLLIVDFEAHKFDDFRERYAHRRLGFTDVDISQWMAEAGLGLSETATLTTSADRPNVRIWLGKKIETTRGALWQAH